MATCKSLRRSWLCNAHFIWDMTKAVLWTCKNCTLEPPATLFLPGQSSMLWTGKGKEGNRKNHLCPPWSPPTSPSHTSCGRTKQRTRAREKRVRGCESRMRWINSQNRLYDLISPCLCTYSNTMQISGYKSLLKTVWYFSYEFWSNYINNTYQNNGNCLNKTKPLTKITFSKLHSKKVWILTNKARNSRTGKMLKSQFGIYKETWNSHLGSIHERKGLAWISARSDLLRF